MRARFRKKEQMQNTVCSKRIRVGKLNIKYFTGGHGEPLVIIHGGGDGARSWLKNARELSEYYSVYIPDLPGFGGSQSINDKFNLPEYVSFVEDFSNILQLESFYLVGHSIGGGIALHYAFRHPDKVSALVLVNSFCLGKEIALWVRVLSASALCKSLGKAALAAIKAVKWLIYQLSIPLHLGDHLNDVKIDMGRTMTTLKGQSTVLHDQLPGLAMPTLVIWGAKDIIVPASHAYVAANTIPDCQLHVFDDCGHSAYKQRVPEFSRVVTRFLGQNRQPL